MSADVQSHFDEHKAAESMHLYSKSLRCHATELMEVAVSSAACMAMFERVQSRPCFRILLARLRLEKTFERQRAKGCNEKLLLPTNFSLHCRTALEARCHIDSARDECEVEHCKSGALQGGAASRDLKFLRSNSFRTCSSSKTTRGQECQSRKSLR